MFQKPSMNLLKWLLWRKAKAANSGESGESGRNHQSAPIAGTTRTDTRLETSSALKGVEIKQAN